MNASDVLKYGHSWLMTGIDGFPEAEWDSPDVCGWWSSRQIMAHLTSFEHLLIEVLGGFLGQAEAPYMAEFAREGGQGFNENQVALRDHLNWQQVLAEYEETHSQTTQLIGQIPEKVIRKPGTLPWYGMEYALDDFIVYTFYGHKREHGAQINVFRDGVG